MEKTKYSESFIEFITDLEKEYNRVNKILSTETNLNSDYLIILETQRDRLFNYIQNRKSQIINKNTFGLKYQQANIYEYKDIMNNFLNSASGYFYGNVGSGKTRIVSALYNMYYLMAYRVFYLNEVEFFNLLFQNDFDSQLRMIEEVKRFRGILFYEDFGAYGNDTNFTHNTKYNIIEYRNKNDMKIIFTSNYSLEKINEIYNFDVKIDRVISRIKELIGKNYFPVMEKDRRLRR